ncbi:C-type lectin lectoxin-Lei1-like [Thamnophis elegans]|uniref:C-type lectin lectoxin-Lei1-like n=1 Tax=Thamnophis elegans TaxID=35005 RepID=UPI001379072B|nr:C-type lectin lectoxin-Lei1-like [Thamnophis elegans]
MGRFIFLSMGLLVVALSLSGAGADHHCPPSWSSFNEFCFKLFKQWETWNDAEMSCRQAQNSSHLASIHSWAESFHVGRLLSRHFILNNVWIGLSDPQKNLTWEWSDGSEVSFTRWNSDPNNLRNKGNCVQLSKFSGYRQWNAVNCGSRHFFICKIQPESE